MTSEKRPRDNNDTDVDTNTISTNTTTTTTSKKIKLDLNNLKPSHTLFVKNLDNKANKQALVHNLYILFSAFGDVISIKLYKCYAFIAFGLVESAKLALRSLQEEEFFERPLKIGYALKESKVVANALSGGKNLNMDKVETDNENGDQNGDQEEAQKEEELEVEEEEEVLPLYEWPT